MALRVLLVDDEPLVLTALAANLRRLEPAWSIATASDIHGAMARLDEQAADAVVCDLHLDDEDGLELLAEVRRHWPACARLALSGMIDPEHLLQVRSLAQRHLVKPCRAAAVRDAVVAAVAEARATSAPPGAQAP
jgi:DNA-binding NarL/FixJ family response regulator